MGLTCVLIPVEHERGVIRGTRALDAAARGDLAPLREVVRELLVAPRNPDPALVDVRRERLAKLEALKAPQLIVDRERQLLALATGEGRDAQEAEWADAEGLRRLLGNWLLHAHTDIDKAWDLIHWLAEPARRARGHGRARETPLDRAFYGAAPAPPLLGLGPDAGYNPPAAVGDTASALARVDPASWSLEAFAGCDADGLPYPIFLPREPEDLDYARHHFDALRAAYERAAQQGLGIAVSVG